MRAILRLVAHLIGATVLASVVLISLTTTAAADRAQETGGQAGSSTPWTVVTWLAAGAGVSIGAVASVTLAVRLYRARFRVGRWGTSR